MNEYLDLLKAAPAAGTGTPDNPYLGMLEKVEDERKARLSATLVTTAGANPDEFAKQRQTAAYLGLPTAAVEAQPDIAQQQARIKQVAQDTANSPTLQRKYSEADFAKLAHDDSGVLSALAAAAKYVFSHPDSKNTLAGDLGAGLYYRSSAALAGGFRAVAELPAPLLDPLVGRVLPANPLRVVAEGFAKIGRESTAKANAISPPAEGIVAGGVTSGFQSLGQNSKYLPLALFGPAGAAAALTGMSAEAGGQSYQDAREKGLTTAQALPFATSQAIIEYGTEKIPLGKLLEGVNAGAPIWKTIAKTAAAEVPGEQLATVLQDMNEWAVLPENKDKPFSEYLAERPSAAAQTLIATLIGAGGNVVIADTARTAIDRMLDIQRGAQQGEATGQNLQQLFALAAQSRLRERAPDTFQALVQELADEPGGVPAEVRFDARTLAGEDGTGGVLNQEQLAAIPSIQAQIGEALATGGEVVVPIGELMQLADSGVEKALIEHARVGANELSQAEAKMAAEQAEQFLQQEAQRVIETARNVQDMQARAETVMQTVLDQLNTASRFTADVNRAYATLVRDFYVTMSERLGITPDELYTRYPLQVVAKATPGQTLNEGLTLTEVRKAWSDAGIENSVYEKNGVVTVSQIVVPKDKRGQGAGTKAMRELTDYADRTGQRIVLSPSTDFGASSKARLVKFYKALGFVENKGRSKDFTVSETMIREPKALEQPAYHGSPFRGIDSFSTQHIGKGEGAQAYGWGLYFAGNKDIAEFYRRKLQGGPLGTRVAEVAYGVTNAAVVFNSSFIDAVRPVLGQGPESVRAAIIKAAERMAKSQWDGERRDASRVRALADNTEMIEALDRDARGQLYTVEVPDDSDLLDYDAKLADQPEKVRKALEGLGISPTRYHVIPKAQDKFYFEDWFLTRDAARAYVKKNNLDATIKEEAANKTGKDIYQALESQYGSDEAASKALAAVGIPGLRYLDAGSRGAQAKGKSHNYVIFHDDAVQKTGELYQGARGFDAWVGDATRVDIGDAHEFKAGEPVVVAALHGTTGDFTSFDKSMANIESDLGGGFYFTNNPADVGENYAGMGPDLTQKIQIEAERLESSDDIDPEEAKRIARDKWMANEGLTMPVWVKFENPVVLGGGSETFLTYEENYNEELDQYDEPTGTLLDVVEALREVASDERYGDGDVDQVVADIMEKAADNGGLSAREFIETAKLSEGLVYVSDYESEGKLASTEVLRRAFEGAGFDGFIDTTVDEKFGGQSEANRKFGKGMKGMDADTVHFIAFKPTQIKSRLGNNGNFDPSKANILEQSPIDTPEFKRWFGDSKVVDAQGKPLVVYHGTEQAGFTVFDMTKAGSNTGRDFQGAYFTNHPAGAATYSGTKRDAQFTEEVEGRPGNYKVFLSIKDPLIVDFGGKNFDESFVDDGDEYFGMDDVVQMALNGEHDGVIAKNVNDEGRHGQGYGRGDTTYVVFNPEQIKSAIGNRGTFDPANPSILEQGPVDTPEFKRWFGDSKVVDAQGKPLVVYHGTTESKTTPTKYVAGDQNAIAALADIAAQHNIPEWSSVPSIFERWVSMGMAERFGVTEADATNARALYEKTKGTTEPGSVALGFDVFNMPEGDLELGSHFGTEAQASSFGDVFPFYLKIENPLRMPDLGTWNYQSVMREARKRGVAISEAEYDAVFNARDNNAALRDLLLSKGIDGFVYENEAEGRGDSYIVFKPSQIKSAIGNRGTFDPANPSILEQGPRGTFNPSTLTTSLLESADLSTFLHETGHFFLTVMADIAAQTNAPAGIAEDMATVLKWFGVKDLETWNSMSLEQQRKHHERFAESFEQYLLEGKAPSTELQQLFHRFRAWLTNVYRSLREFMVGRNLDLNDEVRAVFDRLLASESQIKQAEMLRGYEPLFKSAAEAGMTPQEWAAYQAQGREATDQAIDQQQSRSLRDMRWATNARSKMLKALQKDAAGKRKAVEAEVAAEVAKEPIYQAMRWLRKGEMTSEDGEEIKAEKGFRLSTEALAEMYPDGALDNPDLERLKGMTAANGLHPDVVAGMFGFSSGDQLVRALADAEPMSSVIEGLTDSRMLERFGDLATEQGIQRAADEAIHNEARGRFVATELATLQAAMGGRQETGRTDKKGRPITSNVMVKAAKQFAENIVNRRKVRDLKVGPHTAAETRAAKNAEKALRKGDTQLAITAKRDQLLNHYAARATTDALDEVDRALTYLKKFERDATRKKLDADYLDQIDKLLERVELRQRTLRELDKRARLADWIREQEDLGIEPTIPDYVREDAQLTNYKELTLEEFRGLVDTVKQIEHLGRLKNKLLTAKDQREFEAIRDSIAQSIVDNAGKRSANTRTPTTLAGKSLAAVKAFGAAHIKAATLARVMDGNKDGGPMWEYFVRSANERGDQETAMRAEATLKLAEIIEPWLKAGKANQKKFFATLNRSLTRQEALVIALNTGNEGNLQRLLGGEGWTADQLKPVLESLSAQDWKVVQNIWNHFETYRPLIAEKEKRVFGKEPEWVEPSPFEVTTADGKQVQVKGGYYPIKYDPAASVRAEEHADAEGAKRLLKGAYGAATTRRSFTKSRAEEVTGRPLLYDLSGVYSGVNDVIHDLAWHEWLIDVNRLLKSNAIDSAMRNAYGPDAVRQFKSWRDAIAEGDQASTDAIDIAIGRLRQSVSVAGLGFNVMSALMQPLGFTQSVVRVGPAHVGRGILQYIGKPVEATRGVNEKSTFMRNRSRTRFRELNEIRNRVQGQTFFQRVIAQHAYTLMLRVQQMVDVPTWLGAYEKAIAAGNDETRAIALADQAVIDSQGGGQTKDLAAIERGGQAAKLFTVFYSFMNTTANLAVASKMGPDSKAKFAANLLLLTVVPAVLGSILKDVLTPGDSGDDDREKLAKKLAGEQLSYLLGLVVVGREFGEATKMAFGLAERPRDYAGPAGLRAIADAYKFAKQAGQGEFDDSFRKAAVNLAGDLMGLPAAQINRTITGTKALVEGETQNPAAVLMGYQKP